MLRLGGGTECGGCGAWYWAAGVLGGWDLGSRLIGRGAEVGRGGSVGAFRRLNT
jgi:hypothetical protein